MSQIHASPRLSTIETCSACGHKITMIAWGPNGEQRCCLQCGNWSDLAQVDILLPYPVARAATVLVEHGLANKSFGQRQTSPGGIPTVHRQLDFVFRGNWRGVTATLQWFDVNDRRRDYEYVNKVRIGKITGCGHMPGPLTAALSELTRPNLCPGTLAVTEVSISREIAGRKFVRMEQTYFDDRKSSERLVVRAELSWLHNPADGPLPPNPWD